MKKIKKTKKFIQNNGKAVSISMAILSSLVAFESALAAKDNDAAMKTIVTSSKSIFQGDLLQVALTGGGLMAIIYSLMSGLKVAPLLGGIGLIAFQAIYNGYITSYFG